MLKRGFVSTFSLMRIIPSGLFSTLGDTLGDVEYPIHIFVGLEHSW